MSYYNSGGFQQDYFAQTGSAPSQQYGIHAALSLHYPGCPTNSIALSRCRYCTLDARPFAATTSFQSALTPNSPRHEVLQAHTPPANTRRAADGLMRRMSDTQQLPISSTSAQRRLSIGHQQRMPHIARRHGRSSPFATHAVQIAPSRPAQQTAIMIPTGQGPATHSYSTSFSPSPYASIGATATQTPNSEYILSSLSSHSLLASPAPASSLYGSALAYDTPPSTDQSPSFQPRAPCFGQTQFNAPTESGQDELRSVGEHMLLMIQTGSAFGILSQGNNRNSHSSTPDVPTGLFDDWPTLDMEYMQDSSLLFGDLDLGNDFDAVANTLCMSDLVGIQQPRPSQHMTNPRSVPQMIDGAAWGGHRQTPIVAGPEDSFQAMATTASVPSSTTSSSRQREQRRNGKQRLVHNSARPFQCSQCGVTWPTDGDLQRHARYHAPGRHICPECGDSFHFPKDLVRHWRSQHNRSPYIICTVTECGKRLAGGRIDNIRRHYRVKHPGVPVPDFEMQLSDMTGKSGRTV